MITVYAYQVISYKRESNNNVQKMYNQQTPISAKLGRPRGYAAYFTSAFCTKIFFVLRRNANELSYLVVTEKVEKYLFSDFRHLASAICHDLTTRDNLFVNHCFADYFSHVYVCF